MPFAGTNVSVGGEELGEGGFYGAAGGGGGAGRAAGAGCAAGAAGLAGAAFLAGSSFFAGSCAPAVNGIATAAITSIAAKRPIDIDM